MEISEPEKYILPPTSYVPNSPLPVLVYRNVLPFPRTEQTVQDFIELHGWERKGIVWPAVYRRHFHPNTHECYAIISGSSRVLMGVGKLDETKEDDPNQEVCQKPGLILTLNEGDVIVHPAGTAHSNISDEGHYRYLACFPKDAERWISRDGDETLDIDAVRKLTMEVPIPQDPVAGQEGHLKGLWKSSRDMYFASLDNETQRTY